MALIFGTCDRCGNVQTLRYTSVCASVPVVAIEPYELPTANPFITVQVCNYCMSKLSDPNERNALYDKKSLELQTGENK